VTGAQDCHGGAVEIRSGIALKEIGEGDEGEAILSRRRVAALIEVWSMRSLLDTDIKRQRAGREGEDKGRAVRIQNGPPVQSPQVGPNLAPMRGRDSELDPCLAWVWREQKAAARTLDSAPISPSLLLTPYRRAEKVLWE
jgi:hypothetical protein